MLPAACAVLHDVLELYDSLHAHAQLVLSCITIEVRHDAVALCSLICQLVKNQQYGVIDQIMMCRHLDQNILQSMVDCCKEGMRSGCRHHDLNLQAQASHALGGMEALYNPPE